MKTGEEEEFKSLFNPIVCDIQNHGRYSMRSYTTENINNAYVKKGSGTFLNSDLLRGQLQGLDDMLDACGNGHFAYLSKKDFSKTGAARTMELDVRNFLKNIIVKEGFGINNDYIASR